MNERAGIDTAQSVADLRWLLQSAPLLSTAPGAHRAIVQQFGDAESALIAVWLAEVEAQPAGLAAFLAQAQPDPEQPLRLGHRAERLLEFFLRHGPTHRLVACNIPLRDPEAPGRSTVGEIDFLLEDRVGQRWHWELAVKFFLCTASGGSATAADFVGPERSDTLARKLDKMFGQQLRHKPPVPWNSHDWTPAAFARGWLFYRRGHGRPVVSGLNARHCAGTWLAQGEPDPLPPGDWRWLPRERWLSPAQEPPSEPRLLPRVGHDADKLPRPAIAVCLRQGVETERVFVVPDG